MPVRPLAEAEEGPGGRPFVSQFGLRSPFSNSNFKEPAWQGRSQMTFSDGALNGSVYIGPVLFGRGGREGGKYDVFIELGNGF